jgi:hypothetical protein
VWRPRASARDTLALGTPQVIGGLDLPMLEAYWYQAWAAAADTPGLLGWLERLPPDGYPARAGLLMAPEADLIRDRALGTRAAAQLAPFTAADPDVRALHVVLATQPGDTIAVLRECRGASGDAAELADRVAGELPDPRAAMDMVFGSQWDAALAAGNDLAARARLPAIRTEALNIAASTKEWNELVNSPPGSQDPGAVRRAKVRILDELQVWVTRLRDYLTALGGLPKIEAGGDLADGLTGLTDDWSAEISRLRQFV